MTVQIAVKLENFANINLADPFFDSLKRDYSDFVNWFNKKAINGEKAYVLKDSRKAIQGFLYLKDESGIDFSIEPSLGNEKRLKIGTFKVNSHGTVMGQKFMSIILRKMISERYPLVYVTVLATHPELIRLFKKYGFSKWGMKDSREYVFIKTQTVQNSIFCNFPRINLQKDPKKYLLAVYPQWHSKLFPDSRLNNENNLQILDIAHSNSIEKVYICGMESVLSMQQGDLVVIYRTADIRPAEYHAVATSLCTVVEVKTINSFKSLQAFLDYCKESVFSKAKLITYYKTQRYPYIIKMLYDFPLNKRIIRRDLANEAGLDRNERWGCIYLNDAQFKQILRMGAVDEGFIIN